MSIIKKYFKKDIYIYIYIYIYLYIYNQKEDQKLLMIWDWNNSIIVEYQKILNLLDNTLNQPSKVMTKNWVETNANSRGIYNTDSQINFKTVRSVEVV